MAPVTVSDQITLSFPPSQALATANLLSDSMWFLIIGLAYKKKHAVCVWVCGCVGVGGVYFLSGFFSLVKYFSSFIHAVTCVKVLFHYMAEWHFMLWILYTFGEPFFRRMNTGLFLPFS